MQLKLPGALALALFALGCSRAEPTRELRSFAPRALEAPASSDIGRDCADVMGGLRACWPTEGNVLLVPRPESPRFERGARCWGTGAERKCEDRAWGSDAFSCNGDTCTQKTPRLPDDGEWECADLDGVVVCHGGHAPAGVVPGEPDVGWRCGLRRGTQSDRVCVDLAPDRPSGEPWNCRFHYEPGVPRRSCRQGGSAPLGRACDAGCPLGGACASGHCLPLQPDPNCWIDRDCGTAMKCAYGTCIKVPG